MKKRVLWFLKSVLKLVFVWSENGAVLKIDRFSIVGLVEDVYLDGKEFDRLQKRKYAVKSIRSSGSLTSEAKNVQNTKGEKL